jgi:hypothetical protein
MIMQREIEALLKAYVEDSSREARLVQNVLTALAVGAAARQRMIEDIQTAVGIGTAAQPADTAAPELAPDVTPARATPILKSVPKIASDDVALAISQLRAARDGHIVH